MGREREIAIVMQTVMGCWSVAIITVLLSLGSGEDSGIVGMIAARGNVQRTDHVVLVR